ncbi:MAG TPA: response regulator [Bacteroidia bacterium]|jgi:CheY-like chemotaxis protein
MNDPLRCFLIDDDIDDQKIFSIITEEIDADIVCLFAGDGTEGLAKLNTIEQLPDIIFLDVNMPKMDGVECLQRLKQAERLKDIPVFMYSTTADPETVSATKKMGIEDYIVKPNNINDLVNILSDIYSKYKKRKKSASSG